MEKRDKRIDFDNVKVLIQDNQQKYLVGRRYDTKFKYSTLGGHRERGEDILQTMSRELQEETSGVLKIRKEGDRYFLSDQKFKYPIEITDVVQSGKQIYVLIYIPYDLEQYIDGWKDQFSKNQEQIIMDEIELLRQRYPDVPFLQWLEYFFKFKDDYSNKDFEKVLSNIGFGKTQIRKLISEFEEIGYFLEMDDLELVSLKDLEASDGLYERNFVKML
jgi:8-oxo-dGTP pyrophosphatase MutT (NUDIX family)